MHWLRCGAVPDYFRFIELRELRCRDLLRDVGIVYEQLRELRGGSDIWIRCKRLCSVCGWDIPGRELHELRILRIRQVFGGHRCELGDHVRELRGGLLLSANRRLSMFNVSHGLLSRRQHRRPELHHMFRGHILLNRCKCLLDLSGWAV